METDELHAEVSKLKMLMSEEEQKMQRYKVTRIDNKSHLSSLGDLTDGLVCRVLGSSMGGRGFKSPTGSYQKLKIKNGSVCCLLGTQYEGRTTKYNWLA